jgi:hypothetical protein
LDLVRGIEIRMARDAKRCWPGYEPVKGKKANEQGSCRPKAKSKLTAKEQEFRKKRKKQLDRWEQSHPGAKRKSAQHLRAPGARVAKRPGR